MSALGNGSLTGIQFNNDKVLPANSVTSTHPVPNHYESNLVGGKRTPRKTRRKNKSASIRSTIDYSYGGSKKRKIKKSKRLRKPKTCKLCNSMW